MVLLLLGEYSLPSSERWKNVKNATQSVALYAFEKRQRFQQKDWYDSNTAGQAISRINQRPNVCQRWRADTGMSRVQEIYWLYCQQKRLFKIQVGSGHQ